MRPYLAVDWGTSNVRAWRINEAGAAEAACEMPLGVGRIAKGDAPAVFARIRAATHCDDLPALLCGMIGSTLGWREAPYVACPASAADLIPALVRPSAGVAIVPGLRAEGITGAPDVMRGEETQVFGWRALYAEPAEAHLCLPGTHSKWVRLEGSRLTQFTTALTGELYDVLTKHSVLRADTSVERADAFLLGVNAAGDGGALSSRLFGARARVVTGSADAASTASYLSGLLIGAEIAALAPSTGRVTLIGAPALTTLYARALQHRGLSAREEDGADAVIAGLNALVQKGALDAA